MAKAKPVGTAARSPGCRTRGIPGATAAARTRPAACGEWYCGSGRSPPWASRCTLISICISLFPGHQELGKPPHKAPGDLCLAEPRPALRGAVARYRIDAGPVAPHHAPAGRGDVVGDDEVAALSGKLMLGIGEQVLRLGGNTDHKG